MKTTSSTSNPEGVAKRRLVCPECGSDDLIEDALGRRRCDVTYYADGSFDIGDGDDWETESWSIECNDCSAFLTYDRLVEEPADG